jgi:hypothetical protein
MPLLSNRNVIGRQITTPVQEILTTIRVATDSCKNWTLILPDALTTAQLNAIFVGAPTVTGTKTVTASGCTGWAALTVGEKAVLTGKGYTLN